MKLANVEAVSVRHFGRRSLKSFREDIMYLLVVIVTALALIYIDDLVPNNLRGFLSLHTVFSLAFIWDI